MSKRNATGSRSSRKRRKGGTSYATVDLDSLGDSSPKVENIRVWKVAVSETTGRVSATRRNYRHFHKGPSELSHEDQPSVVEDVDTPAIPEPNKQLPVEPAAKRKKKKVKVTKENDSVSFMPILSLKPILTYRQTKMENWLTGYRLIMLDEILRRDGLGDSETPGICVGCRKLPGKYRCSDCFGDIMWCSECTVLSHRHLPLHRIQVSSKLLVFWFRYKNFHSRSGRMAFLNG